MFIDFNLIKKQSITKEFLLELIEKLYSKINSAVPQNIVINEFVDNVSIDVATGKFEIELENPPISKNDIFIVSENGEVIVTPIHIKEINKNKISFFHQKIKGKINFFVTYKY